MSASVRRPDENVAVAGIGGTGCHVVSRLMEAAPPFTNLVIVDTDWACVRACFAHRKVELRGAPVRGFGTGIVKEWAEKCAVACAAEITDALRGCAVTILVAGLGGGTGSGASPVVARIARDAGSRVAAVVNMPLALEGQRRQAMAEQGLDALRKEVDSVLVVHLERLLEETGTSISLVDFYDTATRVLCDRVLSPAGGR